MYTCFCLWVWRLEGSLWEFVLSFHHVQFKEVNSATNHSIPWDSLQALSLYFCTYISLSCFGRGTQNHAEIVLSYEHTVKTSTTWSSMKWGSWGSRTKSSPPTTGRWTWLLAQRAFKEMRQGHLNPLTPLTKHWLAQLYWWLYTLDSVTMCGYPSPQCHTSLFQATLGMIILMSGIITLYQLSSPGQWQPLLKVCHS